MPLNLPPSENIVHGLRALKTVAANGSSLDATQRSILAAAQKHLLHTSHDLDALEPITPEELAAKLKDPVLRNQLVEAMVALTLAGVEVPTTTPALLDGFAYALEVKPDALRFLREYTAKHTTLLRLDFVRHSFLYDGPRKLGTLELVRALSRAAGVTEDREMAQKYRRLEKLPEESLGHNLWRFYQTNGFAFPGEKHGAPENVVSHDMSHIFSGYGTDIEGESQVIGFQAGYRKQGAMSFLLFLMVQLQVGVRVTYLSP
jgi:hypothetical protein